MRGNSHVRFGAGEKLEMTSKTYLWLLIVILLVVVVGAFLLKTYQGSIIEIWNGIVDKAKQTFGI